MTDILASVEKVGVSLLLSALPSFFVFLSCLIYNCINVANKIDVAKCSVAVAVAFVFGLLALVFGLTMSASRVGSVGNVVPAALAFVGGIALWLVTSKEVEKVLVFAGVFAFSAMFLLGTVLGSYERQRSLRQSELSKYDPLFLVRKSDIERKVNAYRASKGQEPLKFEY